MSDRFELDCPCCSARLVVDKTSGEILRYDAPKKGADQTFEAAMKDVQDGARRRDDAFSKAFQRTQNMEDVLQKKFEEARKAAEKNPGDRPLNPLDID